MPLRNDSSLWWNLPGVVAAYQPVRAPGPLLARYNMRAGGTNAYRAEPGVLPTWGAATGWTFDGTTQYLRVAMTPRADWSLLMRFSNFSGGATSAQGLCGGVGNDDITTMLYLNPNYNNSAHVYNNMSRRTAGDTLIVSPALTGGVLAVAGARGYLNGVAEGNVTQVAHRDTPYIAIGAVYLVNWGVAWFVPASIQACAIFARTLSAAEVWAVTRQMAYCDVNPDWSVWARQRQWYYGAQPGSFQAAWARGSNVVLRGGP